MTLFLLTHPDGSQAIVRDNHAQNATHALSTMYNDDKWIQASVTVLRNEGEQEFILIPRQVDKIKPEPRKLKKSDSKPFQSIDKVETTKQD